MSTAAVKTDATEAITALERILEEARPRLPRMSFSAWLGHVPQIDSITDQRITELVTGLDDSKSREIIARIQARVGRLSLKTAVTQEVVGISKQLLAFGAAGLGLVLAFVGNAQHVPIFAQKFLAIVGILYVELLAVSIVVLLLYLAQARFRYPFLYFDKIGNAAPFFYYSAVSNDISRSPVQLARARLVAVTRYAQDFARFAGEIVGESTQGELRAELQQYFLLLEYQGYVHQFGIRLTNLFLYGLCAVGLTFLTLVVLLMVGAL